MTHSADGRDGREARRAYVEDALARYPGLDPVELQDIVRWFRKEATAFDVGLVASNDRIHANYRQFRAEHVDRISGRDILAVVVFAVLACGVLAAIYWLLP